MTEQMAGFIEPVTDDPDTAGFWDAACRGVLAVQFCSGCGEPVHLPRPRCPACGCVDLVWRDVEPIGFAYSWSTIRHQVHPAFTPPYTIVLVALRDHPQVRLVGQLDGEASLNVGQLLRARFDVRNDRPAVPRWEIVDLEQGEQR